MVIDRMTEDEVYDAFHELDMDDQVVHDLIMRYVKNPEQGKTRSYYAYFARIGLGAVVSHRDGPYLMCNMVGALLLRLNEAINKAKEERDSVVVASTDGTHRL